MKDEPANLDIRYTTLSDAPFLREWLYLPQVQRWFPVEEEREIEDAAQCWIGFSRYSSSLTATLNGTVCGMSTLFLMPYRKVAHHCLFKLVVDPKFQRQGIATALLKNTKHLAKDYFKLEIMHIEVFEDNPFIDLLLNNGFHEFARQEKFVKADGRYLARVLLEINL